MCVVYVNESTSQAIKRDYKVVCKQGIDNGGDISSDINNIITQWCKFLKIF